MTNFIKKFGVVILIAFSLGTGSYYVVDNFIVTPYVQQDWTDFDYKIKEWLPNTYNKNDALALAYAFELAASKDHENVSSLVSFSSASIKAALGKDNAQWKGFLVKVSDHCKNNLQEENLGVHVEVWLKIAASLKKVS